MYVMARLGLNATESHFKPRKSQIRQILRTVLQRTRHFKHSTLEQLFKNPSNDAVKSPPPQPSAVLSRFKLVVSDKKASFT